MQTIHVALTAMSRQNTLTLISEIVEESDFSDAAITLHTLVMYRV